MKLTRHELVRAAAASGLAGAGIYELVEKLAPAPARAAVVPAHLPEQHVLQDLRIVTSDGVQVFAPPLHSELVTATVAAGSGRAARDELERRLQALDDRYPSTPAGLGVTVAWGLPYFRRDVPGQARHHMPTDLRASAASGGRVPVLEDAERFPSDPHDVRLEANDVAVLLRSDSLDRIAEGSAALFGRDVGLFEVMSRRRGFARISKPGTSGSTTAPAPPRCSGRESRSRPARSR